MCILQWLETDFLHYLEEWESTVACRQNFTAAEKKMMLLSDETRLGLKVTGILSPYALPIGKKGF